MAHRGRLNVLAHTVGLPYEYILREFEGERSIEVVAADAEGGTGDVKYHLGARGIRQAAAGEIAVTVAANPSHLEAVDPVVEGWTRAEQTDRSAGYGLHDPSVAMPILLHGDAAFAGQGVVAETLNYYALEGYWTGGTLHVITNNQIGFTTDPEQGRSTRYSSDLAKGFDVPIVHVNADDPEAAISAVRLALAYRRRFGHDVVIDLVGYRRFGHNEQDEAAYTQPLMVEQIERHPTVRELYGAKLVEDGVLTAEEAESLAAEALGDAARGARAAQGVVRRGRPAEVARRERAARDGGARSRRASRPSCCAASTSSCCACPTGSPSTRSSRASSSAAATALDDGRDRLGPGRVARLRLAARRRRADPPDRPGHRARHVLAPPPRPARRADRRARPRRSRSSTTPTASFEIYNSPLSEFACVGFEYGYSAAAPEALVLWEAQFGDFANGAQTIIDQFIVERPREVEADLTPDAAAPARVRGQRPRALERAARALPPARRAGEHPHRQLHDRRAVLPPAAAAGARPERAAARRDDAEGAAPAEGRRIDARRPRPRGGSSSCSTPTRLRQGGRAAARALHREDLLRHRRPRGSRDADDCLAIARIEQLYPFPVDAAHELIASYPHARRGRLGAGGAAEHGRVADDPPPARGGRRRHSRSATSAGRGARAPPRATRPRTPFEQDRIVRAALERSTS